MKKVKFNNWRDARGSELEKAKKVIADKKVKLVDISKNLGIPYETLKNYRQDISKLDKASWSTVNKLSQLGDIVYVQDNMTAENTVRFISHLTGLFQKLANSVDDSELPIINKLRDIVISDPLIVTELFKYKEE